MMRSSPLLLVYVATAVVACSEAADPVLPPVPPPPPPAPFCGDGIVQDDEACDVGDNADTDGCDRCQLVDGWMCTGEPSVCERQCGNGEIDGNESCDDGNRVDGDGCAACQIEPGFTCVGEPSICRGPCEPRSCLTQDQWCGLAEDGCGRTIDCGVCGRWRPMSRGNAPMGRREPAVAWTGTHLVMWGGRNDIFVPISPIGAMYDLAADEWIGLDRSADSPGVVASACTAVFDDGRVFVWGGFDADIGEYSNRGSIFDPSTRRWRQVNAVGAPGRRIGKPACVVTNGKVIVFGGRGTVEHGEYDPVTEQWRPLPEGPVPTIDIPVYVWTGEELVFPSDGIAYQPATRAWRVLPRPRRAVRHYVWTGEYIIAVGAGTLYDPTTDEWRETAPSLPPRPLGEVHWTGQEILTWGCFGGCFDGYHHDFETGVWRRTAYANIGLPRMPISVWTGEELMVLYCSNPSCRVSGRLYDPDEE